MSAGSTPPIHARIEHAEIAANTLDFVCRLAFGPSRNEL
jgi:hypothetical protein